jgi:hypothetical protein
LCGEGAAVNRYPPGEFIEINRVDRICMTMLDKYRSYVIKAIDIKAIDIKAIDIKAIDIKAIDIKAIDIKAIDWPQAVR